MTIPRCLAASALVAACFTFPAQAEDIKLRIASGHPTANTYVNLMNTFFVPEVTKRVAAKTKHKVEFIEGYGGSSVTLARSVYDKVPYMSKVFEDKYNQVLLGLIADNGYNLGTNFEWKKVSDLKGRKLAGAGLNLKWLEYAGAVPVQSSLPDAYTSMKTGV